jgi:hypothetical protein
VVSVVPLTAAIDAEHGGRWTSLRGGGREWLWQRDEPRRSCVRPGDAFADAGGLEECLPTVRGVPDHGDVWTRRWTAVDKTTHTIRTADFELTRNIHAGDSLAADYLLTAEPGFRFIWAAHALLDLSHRARLTVNPMSATRLFLEADGADWTEGDWARFRLSTLGPDDGSAVGAVINTDTVVVDDDPDQLRMTLQATTPPVSIALWRNLRGFPPDNPYRSIGVEPMLGRVFDLARAGDGDCVVTPATGEVRWRLTIDGSTHGSAGPAA